MLKEIELWKNKVLNNYQYNGGSISKDQVDHIIDWLQSPEAERHRKRILRISVPIAIKLAKRWTIQINKKLSDDEDFDGIKTVYSFDDGYCFLELTSQTSYEREGKLMGHCLSRYNPSEQTIFSLRDKNNFPHCTIEVKKGLITQIQGKENKAVVRKYHKHIQEFIIKFKLNIDSFMYPLIGLIEDEQGKIHDLYNLTETLVYTKGQDINLSNLYLTFIPDIVTNGSLTLINNQIAEIPKDFQQRCSLCLYGNKIKEIPEGFKQNGYLNLNYNQISKIPKNFEQRGALLLIGNKITEIPEGFKHNGYLNLINNKITEIPKDFQQNGELLLNHNQISEIPEGFKQNGDLQLCHNKIKKIPESFKQNGALYLSNNQITEIPEGFKQNNHLDLSNNQIKKLPKELKKNQFLDLSKNYII